jgi:CheY-like chemotaxis protein
VALIKRQDVGRLMALGEHDDRCVRDPEPEVAIPVEDEACTGDVLLVDDNTDASLTLAMLLRLEGHNVAIADAGQEALRLAPQFRPDVVLLDIGMPGMDGLEVARRVRKRADFDNIVLIALTGWGQTEDRNRTKTAGFDHHLVKPADITTLQSLLISAGH